MPNLNLSLLEVPGLTTEEGKSKIQQFYSNGLSKYTEKVSLMVTSDVKECFKIWNLFSKNDSLFDLWGFRSAFNESYGFPPLFLNLKNESEILATLPLCFDKTVSGYRWFGTSWQEDNVFFAKDPLYIPILLYLAPKPISLYAIKGEGLKELSDFVEFKEDDPKYFLDVSRIKNPDDYLAKLKKKRRYNLKRDRKRVLSQNPQIVINDFSNYEKMVEVTMKRFRQKGEISDWEEEPQAIETFRKILFQKDLYTSRMISVVIGNEIAAVDLIAIYKDVYYCLKGGYNVEKYPGVGNFLNLLEIDDAIKQRAKKIDFLQIDYGWKKRFFEEQPLYCFTSTQK